MENTKEETVNLKEENKSEPQEIPVMTKSAAEIQAELEKTFFKSSTIEQPTSGAEKILGGEIEYPIQ